MPVKKPSKATSKKAAKKAAPKKAPSRKAAPKKAAAHAKAKPKAADKPSNPMASRMAAFSAQVIEEEAAPVAVRSWTEAKTGSDGSKQLIPKTGEVVGSEPEPEEDEEPSEEGPTMEPMTGHLAVPKAAREPGLEFAAARRGKKGKVETKDSFGQVELRQATASGGIRLTKSKADNLQKGASRIQPLASSEDGGPARARDRRESFESGKPVPSGPALTDWGDVEIGQQTLSGSRKVGKLKKDPEDEA